MFQRLKNNAWHWLCVCLYILCFIAGWVFWAYAEDTFESVLALVPVFTSAVAFVDRQLNR